MRLLSSIPLGRVSPKKENSPGVILCHTRRSLPSSAPSSPILPLFRCWSLWVSARQVGCETSVCQSAASVKNEKAKFPLEKVTDLFTDQMTNSCSSVPSFAVKEMLVQQ